MKEIELSQGMVATVDDDMYEELNQYKWYAHLDGRRWYARRNTPHDSNGKRHTIYMARVIMNAQPEERVDHKDNMATLNNQRENLRLCTNAQNNANRSKWGGCSSMYKGVYWDKQNSKWRARITAPCRRIHLGLFNDEIEAARAYNEAATEHFGEFARLNAIEIAMALRAPVA